MHKLQMYEDLRDMLEREVKDIERKGEMSEQSLDHLYKLMTAIKVVDKCIEREKGEQGGQGQGQEEMMRGMSMGGMSNARGQSNNSYGNSNRMMPYPYMSYDGMSNEGRSYAYDGGSYAGQSNQSYGQSYERGRSNEGGMSNERGRSNESYEGRSNEGGQSNARRGRDGDSDGRYNESRDSFRGGSNRGGSYDGSYEYSRDASKKKMIQKLETLMDDTMSEHERKAIMECIEKIK